MSKKSKRPRLHKTVASDIAPRDHFTHTSNTPTRTRQITTSMLTPSDPTQTTGTSTLFEMYPESSEAEVDPPAGVEILTKGRRYINSVSIIIFEL
jgi:hypothetical protein